MSKHTPGPWVVSNNSAFLIRAGDAETGRHIAQVGPANYHPSVAVDEPNARLIAAAPDLLEALESARDWIDFCKFSVGGGVETLKQIDAAIARARGES